MTDLGHLPQPSLTLREKKSTERRILEPPPKPQNQIDTLPETNSSPLKIGHPKRKVYSLRTINLQVRTVSFRDCKGYDLLPIKNCSSTVPMFRYILQPGVDRTWMNLEFKYTQKKSEN